MSIDKTLAFLGISIVLLLSGCTKDVFHKPALHTSITDTEMVDKVERSKKMEVELPVEQAVLPLDATIDWTSFLKPLMSGCRASTLFQTIPSTYKQSIDSIYRSGDPTLEENSFITTYKLNNATAFGYPITSIEYLEGYEWHSITLFFKDSDFINLRAQFEPPEADEYSELVENNNLGYEHVSGAYTSLKFNTEEKSITCESGI